MIKRLAIMTYLLTITMMLSTHLNAETKRTPQTQKNELSKLHKARIKTAKGDILFKFNEKVAPKTSLRLKQLIAKGFYDGIKFHRVVPGFVIQAGDPLGTGAGGSGQKLKAEFSQEKHVLGTMSMARKGNDIHSADSQFYISLGTHPHLDGSYTVFGKVISGIEVAQKISQGDKIIKMKLE